MTGAELSRLLGARVLHVESRPFAYASSHPLELLDVRLANGRRARLVLKDTGAHVAAARDAKPAFLADPARELDVYRRVLAGSGAPVPRLVAAAGRRLLLEHVPGAPLTEVGDLDAWECGARALARMHRRLRGRESARLLRYDRALFERWLGRARALAGDAVEPLTASYGEAIERVAALPVTTIHGDLYASNVLVQDGRICFLDWESAGVGAPLLDLAALTSGAWAAAERDALVAAYAEEDGATIQELRADLDCCRLLLAVQWLGWSPTWSPPPCQRRDWLREARRAAGVVA